MRNISDVIEQYLKSVLQKSEDQTIEIQRNDLAERFQCVPSQINYVIRTRFTLEKGYMVQSKRGGGGYIRIQKLKWPTDKNLDSRIFQMIGDQVDQESAEGLIYQLEGAGIVTKRESRLLTAAISRDVLSVQLPLRDQIRAKLLKEMLIALLSR